MSVKVIKLVSGEDVIADIEKDQHGYMLNNPAQIMVQQTQDGRVGAAFAPFAPYAKDGKVRIFSDGVIGEMELDVKLINEYNRIFGSGIMIAGADEIPPTMIQ